MRYTYVYKTSDGIRHEGSLSAGCREEVFESLRSRGIKAIKVIAADGSKANGEVVLRGVRKRIVVAIAVSVAVATGLVSYFAIPRQHVMPAEGLEADPVEFTSGESRVAFTNLEAKAMAVLAAHADKVESLELDLLANYSHIEHIRDTSLLTDKIRRGYKAVDASRAEVRELFKSIFILFSADCAAERTAAQRLYAKAMDVLDVSEGKIANDEKALKLLDANRGRWHCKKGKVIWQDPALANEFEYFRREVSPSATRWSRDFSGGK